jgi:hypothetical protein
VIALVSRDNNPNEKSKKLFKKFKESKVKEYLNENSLNQAGYEVEIENYNEMDNADVDDYFYAFDKEHWKTKGLFKENFIKKKKTITQTDDGKEVIIEKDDIPRNVLSYENVEIDYITIEEYDNKLKTKNKFYNGGVIILADFQSDNDMVAFSRPNPLDHYFLFMYSNSVSQTDCYSHEMGHMLGLPHSFFTSIEKETYKNAKENILGNALPVKNPDGTKNENYRGGVNVAIEKAKNKEYDYMNLKNFYSDRKTIEIYINNFNNSYKKKLSTINYTKSDKEKTEKMIRDNTNALIYLKESEDCSYKNFKIVCHILVDDYYKLSQRFKKYLLDILKQINLNQLFFKQKTTKNTMDYRNTRLFFTNTQIRIMRNDSINYIEVLCNCNNGKKKVK